MIDIKKIILDSKKVFLENHFIQEKIKKISNFIDDDEYIKLHRSFLVPLNLKFDVELFKEEIKMYDHFFEQWGKHHAYLPRYGLALVNQDGKLKHEDPINGSLYEYNSFNPKNPLIESDCRIPTEVYSLTSLSSLKIFEGYWCRSNILKWHKGAEFKPHIDNFVPAPWLRLWATTSDNIVIRFYNETEKEMRSVTKLEKGRIYLIDTSLVHDAMSNEDEVFQLFLCVLPEAKKIIENLL